MKAPAASTVGRREVPRWVTAVGIAAATWCLGFAGVSVWDILTGLDPANRFAAYTTGLTVASILVLPLKLAAAAVALAAIRPRQTHQHLVATALWGAFSLLTLYSAGNIAITVATLTGLVEPTAAWQAAGGVSVRAVLYVLFFLAGAAMFGVLAISYHRRHRTRWAPVAIGILGRSRPARPAPGRRLRRARPPRTATDVTGALAGEPVGQPGQGQRVAVVDAAVASVEQLEGDPVGW